MIKRTEGLCILEASGVDLNIYYFPLLWVEDKRAVMVVGRMYDLSFHPHAVIVSFG